MAAEANWIEVDELISSFSTTMVPTLQTYITKRDTTTTQLMSARGAIRGARVIIETLHLTAVQSAPRYDPEMDNPSVQQLCEYVLRDLMLLKEKVLPHIAAQMDPIENRSRPVGGFWRDYSFVHPSHKWWWFLRQYWSRHE